MKSYFKHYEGEKKVMKMDASGKPIGFVWEKKSAASANHFFDCRIYNLAIREILVDKVCKDIGLEISNWNNYCAYMTS